MLDSDDRLPRKRTRALPPPTDSAAGAAALAKPKDEPSSSCRAERSVTERSSGFPDVTRIRTGPRRTPELELEFPSTSARKTVCPASTENALRAAKAAGE